MCGPGTEVEVNWEQLKVISAVKFLTPDEVKAVQVYIDNLKGRAKGEGRGTASGCAQLFKGGGRMTISEHITKLAQERADKLEKDNDWLVRQIQSKAQRRLEDLKQVLKENVEERNALLHFIASMTGTKSSDDHFGGY